MSYYATKNGITREINKSSVWEYKEMGWTVSRSADDNYDPFIATDVKEENRLTKIIINGEEFVGYSSFSCVNTKTYVEEPERSIDGSIPNISDYETFIVPRVKVSFAYMTIDDFRRFIRATTPNEFSVTYYDYEYGKTVTHKMYIEPREMSTIFNKGYEVLAITGQEISLIGTLNDDVSYTTTYYDTTKYSDLSSQGENAYIPFFTKDKLTFGQYDSVVSGSNYSHNKKSSETGTYTFKCWNTKPDGTGDNYATNQVYVVSGNLSLYAVWVITQ